MTKSIEKENCTICLECGGYINSNLFRGEEACSQCGLIAKERLFSTFDHGKKKPETISSSPQGSRFGYNLTQKKILKISTWTENNFHKNLKRAFIQLKRICGNLNLPPIVKYEAKRLYIQVLKMGLVKGYSIPGMVCACIFHSCYERYYRSLSKISDQIKGLENRTTTEKKHVVQCYTVIFQKLHLKYQSKKLSSRVTSFVSEAGLGNNLITATKKFLELCNTKIISNGKDPNGVIAAAIYLMAKKIGQYITLKKISRIASVTTVTTRARIKVITIWNQKSRHLVEMGDMHLLFAEYEDLEMALEVCQDLFIDLVLHVDEIKRAILDFMVETELVDIPVKQTKIITINYRYLY